MKNTEIANNDNYNYYALVVDKKLFGDIIGMEIYNPNNTPNEFKKGNYGNMSISRSYKDDNGNSRNADIYWGLSFDDVKKEKDSIIRREIKKHKEYIKILNNLKG